MKKRKEQTEFHDQFEQRRLKYGVKSWTRFSSRRLVPSSCHLVVSTRRIVVSTRRLVPSTCCLVVSTRRLVTSTGHLVVARVARVARVYLPTLTPQA